MIVDIWKTADELAFIKRLGWHRHDLRGYSDGRGPSPQDHIAFLRGYLQGAEHRWDWGEIDSALVIDEARCELEQLESAESAVSTPAPTSRLVTAFDHNADHLSDPIAAALESGTLQQRRATGGGQ